VSDRFGAQMGWARTGHQACLAHLLRDVQYAIEAGDGAFAPARDCREFRARLGMMGAKEPAHAETQRTSYS
jgi:transposase